MFPRSRAGDALTGSHPWNKALLLPNSVARSLPFAEKSDGDRAERGSVGLRGTPRRLGFKPS